MSMQKSIINTRLFMSSLVISSVLAGCASTSTVNEKDPWEGWNRGTQEFNDDLDKAVLKPVAKGYMWITPKFVDEGITNFFSNMNDIGVTVNDLLQLKMLQGGMDASRFLVNTTIGVAGFIDVAKMIDLPKHNEDFGQTLGFWGVPTGNYLVVPFMGASSPREVVGAVGDALLNPLTYTFAFAGSGAAVSAINAGAKAVDVTDTRADLIPTEKIVDEASVDRYSFIKNAYQQRREYLLHDGKVPEEDELQLEDEATTEGANTEKTNSASPASINTRPGSAPVTDNSKHFLDLSAPVKK
ncbi:MAG: VacJ family lipoprotein [Methylobacter sp.]|uniref:MlaA family lipoprotein n=1 Tax=Methylobacter sp. TaxID=2051955 RepID=UPI002715D8E0|nr:VacJ family lipoprotein [Methylobacter sp.]MDO9269181.1 VacJ family lipoprotein [Methylobacter sp.]MDP1664416.1 VacJ family lipoprotein [Methylobacter sp.]